MAGCSDSSGRTKVIIDKLILENDLSGEWNVEITVAEKGESVFTDSYTIGARGSEASQRIIGDPTEEPGAYTVKATADGTTKTADVWEVASATCTVITVRNEAAGISFYPRQPIGRC